MNQDDFPEQDGQAVVADAGARRGAVGALRRSERWSCSRGVAMPSSNHAQCATNACQHVGNRVLRRNRGSRSVLSRTWEPRANVLRCRPMLCGSGRPATACVVGRRKTTSAAVTVSPSGPPQHFARTVSLRGGIRWGGRIPIHQGSLAEENRSQNLERGSL